jgi:hypothetical protein
MTKQTEQMLKDWLRLVLFNMEEGTQRMYKDVLSMRYSGPRGISQLDEILLEMDITEFHCIFLARMVLVTVPIAAQLRHRQVFYKRVWKKTEDSNGDLDELRYLACSEYWT